MDHEEMEEEFYVDEFEEAIVKTWDMIDAEIPHSTNPMRRSMIFDRAVSNIMEQVSMPVIEVSRRMCEMIESVEGVKFSKEDIDLVRIALYHQVICNQISIIRDNGLSWIVDDRPRLGHELAATMFKENEFDSPEYPEYTEDGPVLS